MTEIKLDTSELELLVKKMEKSPEVIREAKRRAYEEAAPKLKSTLESRIVSTIGDTHGKVRSWQEETVGSKGGYAAVRPKAKTYTDVNGKGKRYAVGYVTNAINSGHKFPSPSGRRGYNPRIRIESQNVSGRYFYEKSSREVMEIAQSAVEQTVSDLVKHLEG